MSNTVALRAAEPGDAVSVVATMAAAFEHQRLFAAWGYVETSREAHPGFDHPTSITMRKPLAPGPVGPAGEGRHP